MRLTQVAVREQLRGRRVYGPVRTAIFESVLAAGAVEGEEQCVFLGRGVLRMCLYVLVTEGPEGALSALLFAGGLEEVGRQLAVEHNSGGSRVEPSFTDILL